MSVRRGFGTASAATQKRMPWQQPAQRTLVKQIERGCPCKLCGRAYATAAARNNHEEACAFNPNSVFKKPIVTTAKPKRSSTLNTIVVKLLFVVIWLGVAATGLSQSSAPTAIGLTHIVQGLLCLTSAILVLLIFIRVALLSLGGYYGDYD